MPLLFSYYFYCTGKLLIKHSLIFQGEFIPRIHITFPSYYATRTNLLNVDGKEWPTHLALSLINFTCNRTWITWL